MIPHACLVSRMLQQMLKWGLSKDVFSIDLPLKLISHPLFIFLKCYYVEKQELRLMNSL